MIDLLFDEVRLRKTAQAVIRFNKYAVGYTEEEMISRMRSEANIALARSMKPNASKHDAWDGYWATCGFVLTFWIDENGVHQVTPSVDPNLFS